jgi:hypothetical protein
VGPLANILRLMTAYYTTRSNSDEYGSISTRRGLAAAAMALRRRPARLEAALEALDVADREAQRSRHLTIRDPAAESGLSANPGDAVP